MQADRRLLRGATVAAVLVLGVLVMPSTSSALEPDVVKDGGFEAAEREGSVLQSPEWVATDSVYDSPLCSSSTCSNIDGARTGDVWAWFGGSSVAGHTASLTQTISIPDGSGITLDYWYWRKVQTSPYDASLVASIDGVPVQTHTESAVVDSDWVHASVDISAYADGQTHELSFSYANPDGGSSSIYLDDVSVTLPARAATPVITSPDPLEGHHSSDPTVTLAGTSDPGTTVEIYEHDNSCTGTPVASGTAEEFAAGIEVTVPHLEGINLLTARTVKPGFLSSHCGSEIVLYTHDSIAPEPPGELTVSPSSPGVSTSPVIRGGLLSEAATVRLFTAADCSGGPVATATDNDFDSDGFTVNVAEGSTTTWHLDAVDRAGNVSDCSTESVTYTQRDQAPVPPTPGTSFSKTPAKKVVTTKRKAKVTFTFTSTLVGSTFTCSVDGSPAKPCTSPLSFKAKLGKHVVKVSAVKAGKVDPTPATYTFKVKKKKKY